MIYFHVPQACGRLPLACAMPLAAAREAATSEAGSPGAPRGGSCLHRQLPPL